MSEAAVSVAPNYEADDLFATPARKSTIMPAQPKRGPARAVWIAERRASEKDPAHFYMRFAQQVMGDNPNMPLFPSFRVEAPTAKAVREALAKVYAESQLQRVLAATATIKQVRKPREAVVKVAVGLIADSAKTLFGQQHDLEGLQIDEKTAKRNRNAAAAAFDAAAAMLEARLNIVSDSAQLRTVLDEFDALRQTTSFGISYKDFPMVEAAKAAHRLGSTASALESFGKATGNISAALSDVGTIKAQADKATQRRAAEEEALSDLAERISTQQGRMGEVTNALSLNLNGASGKFVGMNLKWLSDLRKDGLLEVTCERTAAAIEGRRDNLAGIFDGLGEADAERAAWELHDHSTGIVALDADKKRGRPLLTGVVVVGLGLVGYTALRGGVPGVERDVEFLRNGTWAIVQNLQHECNVPDGQVASMIPHEGEEFEKSSLMLECFDSTFFNPDANILVRDLDDETVVRVLIPEENGETRLRDVPVGVYRRGKAAVWVDPSEQSQRDPWNAPKMVEVDPATTVDPKEPTPEALAAIRAQEADLGYVDQGHDPRGAEPRGANEAVLAQSGIKARAVTAAPVQAEKTADQLALEQMAAAGSGDVAGQGGPDGIDAKPIEREALSTTSGAFQLATPKAE